MNKMTRIISSLLFVSLLPCLSFAQTILEESFSDTKLVERGWYDGGATNALVVYDSELNKNVLEVKYLAGAVTSTMAGSIRHLIPETSELTFTYSVKYDDNWVWTGLGYGPHEFYFLTNKDHAWKGPASSHFTFYIEIVDGVPRLAFQDALNINTSAINSNLVDITENRSVFGCNGSGDSFPGTCYSSGGSWLNGKCFDVSSFIVERGVWCQLKISCKLNSIKSGKGIADGRLRLAINDNVIFDESNLLFRAATNFDMVFNQIMLGPYFHNGTPYSQKLWISNLEVTDSFISSAATTLSTPADFRIAD